MIDMTPIIAMVFVAIGSFGLGCMIGHWKGTSRERSRVVSFYLRFSSLTRINSLTLTDFITSVMHGHHYYSDDRLRKVTWIRLLIVKLMIDQDRKRALDQERKLAGLNHLHQMVVGMSPPEDDPQDPPPSGEP